MQEQVRAFVLAALTGMDYDLSGVTGATNLGPSGLDLESLALADLALQVEERFGIQFDLDEMEANALMTLDEFAAEVAGRIPAPA
ncbi:phosphopantetheine-binding protein [Kitasatospora viridis]|uniref:Acyl carrier protein n=1 Tax=Kitasatospora viridis TaxID=281105 RepID=A0A561UPT3_9ACTN|nr:phosphopantetheine-binding protein [Kitasatospora viridis]TWG01369.1 acyl carrier protein [Kitasatospora viridis]